MSTVVGPGSGRRRRHAVRAFLCCGSLTISHAFGHYGISNRDGGTGVHWRWREMAASITRGSVTLAAGEGWYRCHTLRNSLLLSRYAAERASDYSEYRVRWLLTNHTSHWEMSRKYCTASKKKLSRLASSARARTGERACCRQVSRNYGSMIFHGPLFE